ncbi:MAG: UDP-N-acetylmuramate:L-alanyl-gamma-D-glutamyl-meso-diaminopimelate ligase [Deltaproteobacteria bacterium]|nr:UDP-N-acetylmuramate:L-alanyl-gamma-D-glutamyl-meso-diaminopimelate ligase [Deltaproteobacteria bacterium]
MNHKTKIPPSIKTIYLMAVCGTGMGSLAGLLKQRGYHVCGSDSNIYPPMSTELGKQGIEIFSPYAALNIKRVNPDLVIVGNAISKTNPEADFLIHSSIPYCSMPEALNHFFLSDKEVIVITGTHGKTTTSALMAHMLCELGLDPSFMVGGVLNNFSSNFKTGTGEYFVIEGDEYDTAFFDKGPKFLHYNPRHVIMTSLEFDHADIYKDLNQITQNFIKLARIIPPQGSLHFCDESSELKKVVKEAATSNIVMYGDDSSEWRVQNYTPLATGSEFDIQVCGRQRAHITSPQTGRYNAHNVAACLSVINTLKLNVALAAASLKTFRGIKRRQEILYQDDQTIIIDDFAHHPTAVDKTITAVKEMFPTHHLVAIFEPRSNTSRRAVFQKEYTASFAKAHEVIMAPVNQPEKVADGRILDVPAMVACLKQQGITAHAVGGTQDIIDVIRAIKKRPRVLLVMSNGGFDGIHQKLIREIKQQ